MRFLTETDAVTYIFTSLAASNWQARGLDEDTRDVTPTRLLLERLGLPAQPRFYSVVTGSKGKGSVTTLTARILRQLGHTVGTITSPHLISYRERIRLNGRAIPLDDFLRLVDQIALHIDAITAQLPPGKYLSPQGIFLAMALTWFDENQADIAVVEVGRGGRFDDSALVPNALSLFTPIVLEHTRYLGSTVERIAWHKAGIIKPGTRALSMPQKPEVTAVLRAEADTLGASLDFLNPDTMGRYQGDWSGGVRMSMPLDERIIDLPFYGRYEIENASLAIHAARALSEQARGLIPVWSEYITSAAAALGGAVWPGRAEKLGDSPAVYVDGAITEIALRAFLESVEARITHPLVIVTAVPTDRDLSRLYRLLAEQTADALILTQTERNITIKFPAEADALAKMQAALNDAGRAETPVNHTQTVADAIICAQEIAGSGGTILMPIAQPAIGDAMVFFNRAFEQI